MHSQCIEGIWNNFLDILLLVQTEYYSTYKNTYSAYNCKQKIQSTVCTLSAVFCCGLVLCFFSGSVICYRTTLRSIQFFFIIDFHSSVVQQLGGKNVLRTWLSACCLIINLKLEGCFKVINNWTKFSLI